MKRVLSLVLALLALAAAPVVLAAQSTNPITATVDRNTVTTDDIIRLSVVVDASNGTPQPTMPPLDGFNVISSSTSTNVSMINGVVSGQVTYLYFLQPTRTGPLAIPSISVAINGQTYATLPLLIQVTQGANVATAQVTSAAPAATRAPAQAQPQPTQISGPASSRSADGRVFVEAVIDNANPYIGQQVLYKFRLYQSEMLGGQPSYQGPSFTGFWNNQQPTQAEYLATVDGERYRVTELTNVLFPTASGQQTIEPAHLRIPAGFVEPEIRLQTAAVDVNVLPLPPNPPEGFDGAVGQYTISVRTDTNTIDGSNDSVTLQVTISGAGNLDALPDPVFPETSDWRVYDTRSTTDAEFLNGVYRGSHRVEYTLVPTAEGNVTIPPVSFVYFDPVAEQYNTIATNSMTVTVAPGAAQAPAQTPVQATTVPPTQPAPTAEPEVNAEQPAPLAEPKPVTDGLVSLPRPLVREPAFWLLWTVPLLAFIGELVIRRRERYLSANEESIRSSRALKRARKALAQARRKREDAHGAAARALTGYLSDKVNRPVVGMTRTTMTQMLLGRDISPELIERVETCLSASEAGRYGGPTRGEDNGRAILNETERLLKELDREFAP